MDRKTDPQRVKSTLMRKLSGLLCVDASNGTRADRTTQSLRSLIYTARRLYKASGPKKLLIITHTPNYSSDWEK